MLGLHSLGDKKVIRLFRPDLQEVFIFLKGQRLSMKKGESEGIFELEVPQDTTYLDYQITHPNGMTSYDPYAFDPSCQEGDLDQFHRGVHAEIHKVMGGRLTVHQKVHGAKFCVWAPNALSVALIGEFNHWDGRLNPMRKIGQVWEIFIPGLRSGEKYKFHIESQNHEIKDKIDPYAYQHETYAGHASMLADLDQFVWSDQEWMQRRKDAPMTIYELHLGSWRGLDYQRTAHELADYCIYMGFTHVEVLPITEHPLDESWGYQTTGYYAVTGRYGAPYDFQYFVNHLHSCGIGVILDWVPGHFPNDDFALAKFDGTCLYEHIDPRQGYHPDWNTMIFNYGRKEVHNFLLGSALFFLDKMHIDGFRVDAVTSMLYLDYGRRDGAWVANQYGGRENLDAIDFLKHLNYLVKEKYPSALIFAEDSSTFGQISHSLEQGGLGFCRRWNIGWMNDSIVYFSSHYAERWNRSYHLSHPADYCFFERFILPLSHDEVVHGKKSLLSKMVGDDWEKFANMRLFFAWMMTFPGDKLLFMGGEFGEWREWNVKERISWDLLAYPLHQGLQLCIKDLNRLYLDYPQLQSLHFEWVQKEGCTLVFRRENILCIHHMMPHPVYFPFDGEVLLNTDDRKYGGRGESSPSLATLIVKLHDT